MVVLWELKAGVLMSELFAAPPEGQLSFGI
ncbi:hypothetical protein FHT02_004138 [Sphingomonas xinjiangensis]|uniref:Uncharacterized protein n=1 Tax=Sphingomonas xinjiangensis TaxID=643568 RepID=A0A840YTA8_9SPHN|nr:hypothetical protein [Sphingomonas xinjiangensis]